MKTGKKRYDGLTAGEYLDILIKMQWHITKLLEEVNAEMERLSQDDEE